MSDCALVRSFLWLSFLRQCCFFLFFKQKTAYEMRISDWSSDVCASGLRLRARLDRRALSCRRDRDRRCDRVELGSCRPPRADATPFADRAQHDRYRGQAARRSAGTTERTGDAKRRPPPRAEDRKSVGAGKRGQVSVDIGGRRILRKNKTH